MEISSLTLRLLQHLRVPLLLEWHALQESVHIEAVHQTRLFLLTVWRTKISSIRVEQACEATDKGCADLVRPEGDRTNQADVRNTSTMGEYVTTYLT